MGASRIYMATAADEGTRLDALLGQLGLYASRSAAAKAIEEGRVLVAGEVASKKQQVSAGQPIVYEVDEETVPTPLTGEPIPLDIRFEDDDLIVLSKQAGLVCHPSGDHAGESHQFILVSLRIFFVSTFRICICGLPERSDTNATSLPSGDHVGDDVIPYLCSRSGFTDFVTMSRT